MSDIEVTTNNLGIEYIYNQIRQKLKKEQKDNELLKILLLK